MKLVTDNAFTKAWKISCPTCRIDQPNSILWFKKQCHECEIKVVTNKKYTKEDMLKVWLRCRVHSDEQQLSYEKELFNNFINSLNKQD